MEKSNLEHEIYLRSRESSRELWDDLQDLRDHL